MTKINNIKFNMEKPYEEKATKLTPNNFIINEK